MRPLTQNEVIGISRNRAINETELCKRMYKVFSSDGIIEMLRNFIRPAIEDFCAHATAFGGRAELLWVNVMLGEKDLGVWRLAGPHALKNTNGLANVVRHSSEWTASDCSDLIRLFGAFVENEPLLSHGIIHRDVDASRLGKRPGPGYIEKGAGAQRARERGHYYQSGAQTQLPHIQAGHHAALAHIRVSSGFAGYRKCTLKDCSTVKKIDAVFGLAEGCDISGTTADSVFFMQHVGDFLANMEESIGTDAMPFIQLLPMATMGSQGHHTVLECALTLTLNEIVRYRVGFYGSLEPLHGICPGPLRGIWLAAEHDVRNKHILCFWNPQRTELKGVELTEPGEIQRLRDISLMDESFRSRFNSIPVRHTLQELRNGIGVLNPLLPAHSN